jgi:hypothetical protein
VIGTVQIANASITNATIANLAVGTGNIQGNAVTSSGSATASTPYTPPQGSWQNIMSVSVDVEGGANVLIMLKVISSYFGDDVQPDSGSGGEGSGS